MKLALLDQLEQSLLGRHDEVAEAVRLRTALKERKLSPRHAQDLLAAFRMDVNKLRYRDWDDLIGYCSYSAMPVGRFVCDVHGEDRAVWGANDALCAALQIINHLQDCGADYRNLDRVYVPIEALNAAGASIEDLGRDTATPALRACLAGLAVRTDALLDQSAAFSSRIDDFRLAMEVAVIQALARRLTGMLRARDPLSDIVHLKKAGFAQVAVAGLAGGLYGRLARSFAPLSRSYRA
jgi:squalene synthase HpnC